MAAQKNKRKSKTAGQVERALVPTPVFAAVPHSGTAPAAFVTPSSSGAATAGPKATTTPRILGHPGTSADEFSEPDSSLCDYQQMVDAGYQTVGFGTWPARGRQPQREAEHPQFQFRSSGLYAEPEDIQKLEEKSTPMIKMISDIYATPMKKDKGKQSSKSVTGSGADDDKSMTATHRHVHAEMKKIHDMPAEVHETMSRSVRNSANVSYSHADLSKFPDSGRGSTRPDSLAEGDGRSLDHCLDLSHISELLFCNQMFRHDTVDFESEYGNMENEDHIKTENDLPANHTLERILEASHSHRQNLSGRSSRSLKPISGLDIVDGMEAEQLRMQNSEMKAELQTLQKVAVAVNDGDIDGARTLYIQKQVNELKEDNEVLKSAVHRLNVELSDYQAKYRPVDVEQLKKVIEVNGLPPNGPVPSWLLSKKYLAPLFLAYDDHLANKDELIDQCRKECGSIRKRVEQVVNENNKLRRTGGPGENIEWHQLQEQAKLVLEENQVLMEQLEVQTLKFKDMYKAQETEISRMARKLALLEGEKADIERELEQMRVHFREMKHKHDQLLLESHSHVKVHTHINTISDFKRTVEEEKEQIEKDIGSIRIKLKASEEERKRQASLMIDLTAENKCLKTEIKVMQKSVWQAQDKMAVLHKAIELSENKEMSAQEQLASVIKVAEKTALERDTVYKVAREQQQETKVTMSKMMQDSAAVGKLELKLKLYQMKASAKLNTVADRLREQDEAFNSQRKEYEREIQHLRSLLKEKDEINESLHKEKKNIEKDLDTMWQAATSENKRIKNILLSGTRKLKDHVHITEAIKEEMENEEILHFSDEDSKKL